MQTRRLLLATVLFGGVFEGTLTDGGPARAAGTAAGTAISNTASATYNDPNNAGQALNATSNTVSVTVAEVAGLSAGGAAVTDTTPGHANNILPGDTVNYDFTVTNIGNGANAITLPGAATVTGPGTAGALQYSTDGGAHFTNIPAGGVATSAIPANGTVLVRVPITVAASAATGDVIKVLLGDTGANDNNTDTQNIADPTPSAADVHTNSTTAQNGLREASAFQNGTVGTQPQALAVLLLTRTGFAQGAVPAADTLTYGLGLNVNNSVPTGAGASHALAAADLAAAPLTVNGASAPSVLIANAIPAGTTLTGTPTAPSGWTVVYTTTPTSTVAESAAWTTAAPTDLTTVTRVGFIAPGPVTRGTTLTGFAYTVTTTGASATAPTPVNNIAQLFGQTSGDATNALVYDESGDQSPSLFNDDGSRGGSTPTNGVAAPGTDGTDAGNNDTGTGPGGEDNVYTVSPAGVVMNGPNGQPGATGPNGSNDDFSNLSTPVPPGTPPGTLITPAAVTFTNTLQNPGAAPISGNTLLLPQPPAAIPGGAAADLPVGTHLTLAYGGASAVYGYDGAHWALASGTAISIPSMAAGATLSYTATVQLPANTPLSTDTSKGFPVPILANVDANGNGVPDPGEPSNMTIDRLYTGFLQVTKSARIVAADGTTVIQDYSAGPSSANIQPGRYIDYKITYTNVSSAPAGTGSTVLNAGSAVIIEDGTAGGNNWALDQDGNGILDTSNVLGSAVDSGGGVITFYNGGPPAPGTDRSGTTAATDVTKYVDTISGSLAPGTPRTFTFRRRIN